MNIIELAKEVWHEDVSTMDLENLERFAALVRAEALANPVKQEPVAWMWIPSDAFPDCTVVTDDPNKLESAKAYGRPIIPLYAAPVDAKAIRAEALEEAAKCVYDATDWAHDERDIELKEAIAASIRGLK